ncbi:MAG: hypothetical protein J1F60_06565 [Oscillospiraceae bacterium]|nr:hypothetical protein [Oscillospiraceae bacterium]
MKKQGFLYAIFALLTAMICVLLITDSKQIIETAQKSVTVCLSVIIPSLFAFMVLSQIMISCGIADILFFPLYKISSFWFKGSRRQFSVFLLSLIGGYPVGIRLLRELTAYNKNYTAIAEKMLCYCYCGSPAFIIQIVGLSVFGSTSVGLVVYISNAAACLIIAVVINLFSKKSNIDEIKPSSVKISLEIVTSSIEKTVKALGVICGTILAFNILLELIDCIGLMDIMKELGIEKIFAASFEISNLSLFQGNNYDLLPFFAGITSFGGLCIIMQTAALSGGLIPLKKFILSRIPAALLSGVICKGLMTASGMALESYSPAPFTPVWSSVDPLCSICIIIMTYILVRSKESVSD